MKNITLCVFCLLCLGSMPLWALKGKDDDTPENPKPVVAAANPSASQTTTPAVAKAAPRKVVMSRPDPFFLEASALKMLQSAYDCYKETQKALLEHAARAVELKISSPLVWPDDATQLMAPFANVRSLSIDSVTLDDLPLLPCPEKLESLVLTCGIFQTIQNITRYTNLRTLQIFSITLVSGEINDAKLELLPFDTLEELRLHGAHTLTDLTPLQGSRLRVLHLHCQENLGDTQVICSIQNLEELDLADCRLTDEQAEPLLQLAQRLRQLNLDNIHPRLSAEMCQRLKDAFGNKVSLKIWP